MSIMILSPLPVTNRACQAIHFTLKVEFSSGKFLYKQTQSSKLWLQRHFKDKYVKEAFRDSYRCRSAYKLKEIDMKYKLFSVGNIVIDLGACPGSWCQVSSEAVQSVNGKGQVIGVDLLDIESLEGVSFFTGRDFTSKDTQQEIIDTLHGRLANVVLSDMAPNASGDKSLDHDAICELCLSVLRFSSQVLEKNGHVLCKLWDGEGKKRILNVMDRMFSSTKIVKPKASRLDSSEIYVLGLEYKLRRF